jgi:glycine cleavage system H protein
VTSAAIEDLGELESIELPAEGDEYTQGDVVATVEGTHGRLEVLAPAAGSVEEVNGSTQDEPGVVVEDPLEEGWLVRLEIQNPSELKDLSGLAAKKGDGDEDEDSDDEEEDEEDSDDEEE